MKHWYKRERSLPVMAGFIFVTVLFFSSVPVYPGGFDPSVASSAVDSIHNRIIAENFDSFFNTLSRHRRFNGNVLVGKEGAIIYENTFGFSDFGKRNPLKLQSAFQIASISKQFTAMAIMILHDEGKLNFDDPVDKYLPGFPYQGITIRHLLTHRSGLPDYLRFARRYRGKTAGYMTNDELIRMMTRYRPPLYFTPDDRYLYSNTGYAVLAVIVENVSGMNFSVFMKERIFTPLAMNNTFIYNPSCQPSTCYPTKGYSRRARPVGSNCLDGVVGDKGIYSTVEDMFRWDQGLASCSLVSRETMDEAFTPASYDRANGTEYGFGWRIKTLEDGEKIFYHGGLWGGYNSLFIRRESDNTVIVVLSNRVNRGFCSVGSLIRMIDESPEKTVN